MSQKHWNVAWTALLAVLMLASACVPAPLPTPGVEMQDVATSASYRDPWVYCAAVQTIDAPDERYSGPAMPEVLAAALQYEITGETGTPAPHILQNSFWRCMDGKVYACTVGANLPCTEKANTSRTPTEGMAEFCEEQPNSDFIPMYITGHNTVYEWRCQDGTPEAGREIAEVDAQGYIAGIWYEIPTPQ